MFSEIAQDSDIIDAVRKDEEWVKVLEADPRESLVSCEEPFTVYRTLIDLLGFEKKDKRIKQIRKHVLQDNQVQSLISALPTNWSKYLVKGHQKADYPPSLLFLLFDFGVEPNDSPSIANLLDQMQSLHDEGGKFQSLAQFPRAEPTIGSSLCDNHIITEVLLKAGRSSTPEVKKALSCMTQDSYST